MRPRRQPHGGGAAAGDAEHERDDHCHVAGTASHANSFIIGHERRLKRRDRREPLGGALPGSDRLADCVQRLEPLEAVDAAVLLVAGARAAADARRLARPLRVDDMIP
jgi:hypothetical protein